MKTVSKIYLSSIVSGIIILVAFAGLGFMEPWASTQTAYGWPYWIALMMFIGGLIFIPLANYITHKVIMIEKKGLFDLMKENDFGRRLDAVLMCPQGFSSEAARLMMMIASEMGLSVVVVHDYDINGILILETLKAPTKRRDTYVTGEVVDLGFSYEQLKKLKVRPEPIKLKKGDRGKLDGLLSGGLITAEEHSFLSRYRVELNALSPSKLLEWMEEELEKRDLWKTVPEKKELHNTLRAGVESEVEDTISKEAERFGSHFLQFIGLAKIEELTESVRDKAIDYAKDELNGPTDGVEIDLTTADFKERLRAKMQVFWKSLAKTIARDLAGDARNNIEQTAEDEKEDWSSVLMKDEDVSSMLEKVSEWVMYTATNSQIRKG